ncbi:arylformamidase [Roseibium hamelinense]|uniref:Arylformamidase n=1 Tax=Roseibium hamelinense TaxID=150831 RepID=A0A562T782_9HYPH|nr:alpha/beta hydrolase [Roseibium hamelinense]MTI43733.1 alpha/beta hydrolase [Roseibium hamelinense]TWI89417.1 arylformamidase [Roseibium hamelinense]
MASKGYTDYETQYNNRARVPEHPVIFENWTRRAADFRTSWRNLLDMPYADQPRTTYDFFYASDDAPAQSRTALFIHGGYWQSLDKSSFSHMARGLCLHGFDVAVANYTLCPRTDIAGICREMRLLAAHLVRTWGKPLLVYGHSAGGHLTADLMATDWSTFDLPPEIADRGMPISGLFDLEPLLDTSINKALHLNARTAREASPLFGPIPETGQFIAVVGGEESEEFHKQSKDLVETWTTEKLHGTLDIQAGQNHFTVIDPLAEPDSGLVTRLKQLCQNDLEDA